jgi:hypothetical protein
MGKKHLRPTSCLNPFYEIASDLNSFFFFLSPLHCPGPDSPVRDGGLQDDHVFQYHDLNGWCIVIIPGANVVRIGNVRAD